MVKDESPVLSVKLQTHGNTNNSKWVQEVAYIPKIIIEEGVMNARGNGDEGPEDVVGVGGRYGNSVNTAHSPMKPSTKVKKNKQTKISKNDKVTKKSKVKQ